MKARRLNSAGINKFSEFINDARRDGRAPLPSYLLEDRNFSESIDINIELASPNFTSRFEIGMYLIEQFKGVDIQPYIGDQGFWTWISLFWFEKICPLKNGSRRVSMYYNYILSENYKHRPRHAIYMTWQLVNRYKNDARFMLSKLESRGEIMEQLMARQELLSSEGVVRLASSLYLDPETNSFKRGAAARTSPGCVSRLVSWIQQMQVTFDIYSTSKSELEILLPSEFDRFRF